MAVRPIIRAADRSMHLNTESELILSVKPDESQNLSELEQRIRDIAIEFLNWGEIRIEETASGLNILKVTALIGNDQQVPVETVVSLFYNERDQVAVMEGVASCEIDSWNRL